MNGGTWTGVPGRPDPLARKQRRPPKRAVCILLESKLANSLLCVFCIGVIGIYLPILPRRDCTERLEI